MKDVPFIEFIAAALLTFVLGMLLYYGLTGGV